jgi:hypothetical protein
MIGTDQGKTRRWWRESFMTNLMNTEKAILMNPMKKIHSSEIVRYTKFLFTQGSLALALLVLLSVASLHAQQTTGTIVGTVKDPTGAVINTATVKATNVETGFARSAKTNAYGDYRIDYLPVGKYSVAVEASSFKKFVQQNLNLSVDQTLSVEVALTGGAASETVTVTDAPPLINTSTSELGRTIEPEEIVGLPLVNRNVYSEISLTPGVMANSNSPTTNPSGTPNMTVGLPSAAVQVNGSLDSGNGNVAFYLDGGNNITGMRNYGNPAPNPSALQEFRVETSAFAAEYGQFSGAVVTVITKSGSNKFHGELFEFNRNTDFNAFPWNPALNAITHTLVKNPYHRNNFGGAFGGPIKHDKAFFFFSYAGLRQVQGGTVSGGVTPTAAERMGDFTADTFKVYTPGTYNQTTKTGTQVAGTNKSPNCQVATPNCLPLALLDSTSANFLNVNNNIGVSVPLPTGAAVPASGGGIYLGLYTTPTDSDEYLGKYDETVGEKDHVTVTYFYVKTKSTPSGGGNINWTGNQSAAAQTNAIVSDVHTFSASTANQVWVTFTRALGGRTLIPVTGPATQTLGSFGSNFRIQGPAGLPYLNIGAGFNTGNPNAGPVTGSDNYELRDVVSVTKGRHNLSIGGEFALDKTMFLANLNNYGDVSFATSAPTTTGNAIADFVAGQTSGFEQDSTYEHLAYGRLFAGQLPDHAALHGKPRASLGHRYATRRRP